jgi:tripartite-type tricarboxylate transporter receptor subunit TctC
VFENKPGAGENLATQFVKRAPTDGYSILVHSVAYAVNPSLYPNAGHGKIRSQREICFTRYGVNA